MTVAGNATVVYASEANFEEAEATPVEVVDVEESYEDKLGEEGIVIPFYDDSDRLSRYQPQIGEGEIKPNWNGSAVTATARSFGTANRLEVDVYITSSSGRSDIESSKGYNKTSVSATAKCKASDKNKVAHAGFRFVYTGLDTGRKVYSERF